MSVRLGYIKFSIPMRVSGHELNAIDLTSSGGEISKIVSEVYLNDNGWVVIRPVSGEDVWASPDCCRQAISMKAPPAPTYDQKPPQARANSVKKSG